jgi:hypothetical protein
MINQDADVRERDLLIDIAVCVSFSLTAEWKFGDIDSVDEACDIGQCSLAVGATIGVTGGPFRIDSTTASIADTVFILVFLVRIRNVGTVVAGATDAVLVNVIGDVIQAGIAQVPQAVRIGILLAGVGDSNAIVTGISDSVIVTIAQEKHIALAGIFEGFVIVIGTRQQIIVSVTVKIADQR